MIGYLTITIFLLGNVLSAPGPKVLNQKPSYNPIKFATKFNSNPSSESSGSIYSPTILKAALKSIAEGMGNGECKKLTNRYLKPIKFGVKDNRPNKNVGNESQISLNNELYYGSEIKISNDYFNKIKSELGYNKKDINFADSSTATKLINDDISKNTNKLIENLIPDGFITPQTQIILVNTLYFQADWEEPFNTSLTKMGKFTDEFGKTADITMMGGITSGFYIDEEAIKSEIVIKKFDVNYNMVFILPNEDVTVKEVHKLIKKKSSILTEVLKNADEFNSMELIMPRIKVEQTYDMDAITKATNLTCILNSPLDKIIKNEKLFVNQMIHKAVFTVTEKGAKGAAAGVTDIGNRFGDDISVDLNRPFIYFVYERTTLEIPFYATYMNPMDYPLEN